MGEGVNRTQRIDLTGDYERNVVSVAACLAEAHITKVGDTVEVWRNGHFSMSLRVTPPAKPKAKNARRLESAHE